MESLKEFYKIGNGPSSSHTMGPEKAAKEFRKLIEEKYDKNNIRYKVELYGSLAATGKGHLTDHIVRERLQNEKKDNVEVFFMPEIVYDFHTNALKFFAYLSEDTEMKNPLEEKLYFSVGGGSIVDGTSIEKENGISRKETKVEVYPQKNFQEIQEYCIKEKITLPEYVVKYEGTEIRDYLKMIWETMDETINKGLHTEGYLPGKLKIERKAKSFYTKFKKSPIKDTKGRVYSYALAASEENASAGKVVTAPTWELEWQLIYLEEI